MACCKCEEYGWPDPQKIVWKDEDDKGKEYCVFHAPIEQKGASVEEFNKLIIARIHNFKASPPPNASCHFSGAIFPDAVSFTQFDTKDPLPPIDFYNAQFGNNVRFTGVMFKHSTNFENTTFGYRAKFSGAEFGNKTFFEEVSFGEQARFYRATFGEGVWFNNTTFGPRANFTRATFSKGVGFAGVKIDEGTIFDLATFEENSYFSDCNFGEDVSFKGVTFGDGVKFIQVSFEHPIYFSQAVFQGRAKFTNCPSKGSITYREIQIEKELLFQDMNLAASDFLHTPLNNIRFQNVTWKKSPNEVRYYLPIEDHPKQAGIKDNDPLLDNATRYNAVAEFYRQMKKRCRDEQNDAEASLWHYAEKEVQLKGLRLNPDSERSALVKAIKDAWFTPQDSTEETNIFLSWWEWFSKPFKDERVWITSTLFINRVTLEAYRKISRYGEDQKQALLVLLGLVLALAAIVILGAVSSPEAKDSAKALNLSNTFHVFFQYLLLDRPSYDLNPFFAAIALFISRLLIPIQAAIFAFALRNKLHR